MGRCLPSLARLTHTADNVTSSADNATAAAEAGVVFSDSPTGQVSLDTLEEAAAALGKALGLRSLGDKVSCDWWRQGEL